MLSTLIQKELKSILLSPKFPTTFALCTVLLLLSTYIGIREYQASVKQHETAVQLASQEMRERTGWMGITNRLYRKPDPMQIFVSGVNNDIGRWSGVNQFDPVKLRHSAYSDDPIFAIFRFLDFTFIVQIVLSLFALLFTYDAINGERETGTLALAFSNAVPRAQYLIAKYVGSWLGMVIPISIPVVLSLLMVMIFRVPVNSEHWLRVGSLLGVSLLFFSFFIAFGLLVSTLTRRSNISFLICLVSWVLLILILPRAGVIIADQMISVPTIAEIEGQQDAYAKDKWQEHQRQMEARFQERQEKVRGMSKEERERFEEDNMWSWMEEEDGKRKQMQKEIDEHGIRLEEDLRNRKAAQERLAFALSRFSPASAYQLAVMDLAGTDIALKSRYEDAMRNYRTIFNQYTEKKQKESGGMGGIRITMDSEKGFSFDMPRERGTLNLSDMPQFTSPQQAFIFPVLDFGLLGLFTLLSFAGSFASFLRYDMRA